MESNSSEEKRSLLAIRHTKPISTKHHEKNECENFEFSQAHIHFWDKFERANHFYEAIIETAERHCRRSHNRLPTWRPNRRRRLWNMAMNLIRHGLVPKSAYPESQSSSSTRYMNANLKDILRTGACEIREILDSGGSSAEARAHKDSRLADIWRILCIHLGTPPEKFDWQWEDKDGKLHRKGMMTPQEFAEEFVEIDWEDYVCIVNDPRTTTTKPTLSIIYKM